MKTNYSPRLLTATAFVAGTLAILGSEVREEFHQTYPLSKAGEIGLDNINGVVRIRAWDRDEIQVDAVKRAKKQEHLDAVQIDVQSKPDSVQIKTRYPDGENKRNSASVDYTLTVPRDSKLKKISLVNGPVEIEGLLGEVTASTVNGPVTANGLSGRTTLSAVNGSVKAALKELRQPVSLRSVNGNVTVALEGDPNASVSANTVHGAIHCDFPLSVQKSFPVGQKLEGKLGEGGPQIKLSTVNGGVHIDRVTESSAPSSTPSR